MEPFRALIVTGAHQQLIAKLDADKKPASRKEIANNLATLTAAFPNAAKTDLSVFGLALLEDITAMNPSRYAIDCACRELRRTSKFLPTIAEIIEIVERKELQLSTRIERIKDIPRQLEPSEMEPGK